MYSVVEPLRVELARAGIGRARVPVLSTIDLEVREAMDAYDEVLARSLILPVQWAQALEALRGLDIDTVVDVGPGETLAKLGRRAKIVDWVSLASLRSSPS
jgi:[acyl-carrier-protein] S-malonyltransferase